MQLTRLRIVGFKTFLEPTDVAIEPGLTGIIGPNGCGKSNLVEALRWVMGENSFKAMRASGMDDVIFGGSGGRPARNSAEVTVSVDNAARTAPAAFNDADLLEISRRIGREQGSTYRINGREVRARDVQLLFADAATGARSAAMVRQGQISEIIAAKPQARRRILEDAAGIAGLHARRHEAELRLKAAEDNLVRVEDVLGGLDGQIEGLRRQSRQAARYRAVAADIRRLEALIQLIGHANAREEAASAASEARARAAEVAERAEIQARAAREQAIAAHALPGLREGEAAAAAGLQRLVLARAELDGEEIRVKDKIAALERRAVELERDRHPPGNGARRRGAVDRRGSRPSTPRSATPAARRPSRTRPAPRSTPRKRPWPRPKRPWPSCRRRCRTSTPGARRWSARHARERGPGSPVTRRRASGSPASAPRSTPQRRRPRRGPRRPRRCGGGRWRRRTPAPPTPARSSPAPARPRVAPAAPSPRPSERRSGSTPRRRPCASCSRPTHMHAFPR